MSTRGVIARAKGDGWEGVYHHWDSYPTGLGKRLWTALHQEFHGNVEAFLSYVVDTHRAGWSSFPDHSYTDTDMVITDRTVEPLFHEWVYVFSPRMLTVFGSTVPEHNYELDLFGSVHLDGEEPNWSHVECGEHLERCQHERYVHDRRAARPDYAKGQDFSLQYHQV
ncbi:MAG: hypothetical protein V1724_06525 [Chloroflexota bacterium]